MQAGERLTSVVQVRGSGFRVLANAGQAVRLQDVLLLCYYAMLRGTLGELRMKSLLWYKGSYVYLIGGL